MATTATEPDLSLAVIPLMKGVVYRDTNERAWQHIAQLQPQVRDYVEVLGLQVVIDEAEGHAYLRQRPAGDEDADQVPRLIPRRSLSFHVSLLLALLRKKLAEFDAQGGDTKLMLTRGQIAEMIRVFMPATSNEARLIDKVDEHINKAVELGFLRPASNSARTKAATGAKSADQAFEVRRILKAFIDGQWLADFSERLSEYAGLLAGDVAEEATE
jgi:hypothetical protein